MSHDFDLEFMKGDGKRVVFSGRSMGKAQLAIAEAAAKASLGERVLMVAAVEKAVPDLLDIAEEAAKKLGRFRARSGTSVFFASPSGGKNPKHGSIQIVGPEGLERLEKEMDKHDEAAETLGAGDHKARKTHPGDPGGPDGLFPGPKE